MNAELLAVLVTAALGLLAFLKTPDRQLSRLDTETQILARLDPNSSAAASIREVVDKHAQHLRDDLPLARDWEGVTFFASAYFVLAMISLAMLDHGNLWTKTGGALLGAAAFTSLILAFRQGARVPRDRDGKRVGA